jgi:hypothetical protein
MPYRIPSPSPKEPEPMIPFCDRYPRLHAIGKQSGIFALGIGGLAAILGALWAIGWTMRATGLVSPTDTDPNMLAGLLGIAILMVVVVVGGGTYLLGRGIMCKITGEKFPF